MLVGWGVLSPLAKHKGWAPGPVGSVTDGSRGWIMWIALAIMTTESVISLVPVVAEFLRTIRKVYLHSKNDTTEEDEDEDEENEPPSRLVPTKWALWGLIISAIGGTLIIRAAFGKEGIKPWASIIGFVLATVLSLLG